MSSSTSTATGSSSYTYTISPLAYSIPLLHAAKNLSKTVIGVFLAPTLSGTSTSVSVEQCVPILHNYTSLSPMLEAGLELVSEKARKGGLEVVGFYIGYEGNTDGLGRIGERIMSALQRETELAQGVFGLVIDNDKLGQPVVPYTVYLQNKALPSSNEGFPQPFSLSPSSPADLPSLVLKSIKEDHSYRHVADFDDHLEDPSLDWLNNEAAKKALGSRIKL